MAAHKEAKEKEYDARERVGRENVRPGGLPCVEGCMGVKGRFQGRVK